MKIQKLLAVITLSLSGMILLSGCVKNNEKNSTPSEIKTSELNNQTTEELVKKDVYKDLPDDLFQQIDEINQGLSNIPTDVGFPNRNLLAAKNEPFLRENWDDYFPKSLIVVITVKDCDRCEKYGELMVKEAEKAKSEIRQQLERDNDKVSLSKYELSSNEDESNAQLRELSQKLGIDVEQFNNSRPVIMTFLPISSGNPGSAFTWKKIYQIIPNEDGSGVISSLADKEYHEKVSELMRAEWDKTN